jgi:hypothetical protein
VPSIGVKRRSSGVVSKLQGHYTDESERHKRRTLRSNFDAHIPVLAEHPILTDGHVHCKFYGSGFPVDHTTSVALRQALTKTRMDTKSIRAGLLQAAAEEA